MKKLMILTLAALVVGLALAPAAFAKSKPDPLPGPPHTPKSFDGDVYLFADPAAATAPDPENDAWGKFSWDLWGDNLMFHFKAKNIDDDLLYELFVDDTKVGEGTKVSSNEYLAIAGPFDIGDSFADAVVELRQGSTVILEGFYTINFTYVPAP